MATVKDMAELTEIVENQLMHLVNVFREYEAIKLRFDRNGKGFAFSLKIDIDEDCDDLQIRTMRIKYKDDDKRKDKDD